MYKKKKKKKMPRNLFRKWSRKMHREKTLIFFPKNLYTSKKIPRKNNVINMFSIYDSLLANKGS